MREMFDIKPFNEQLLSGCVFDTNGTEPANALVNRLQRQGAIDFGTTVTCGDGTMPSTSLPHHGCLQAYIKELWETEGAPDDVRVTWPEEFDAPNV